MDLIRIARSVPKRAARRLNDLSPSEVRRGRKDEGRLYQDLPTLKNWKPIAERHQEDLADLHAKYTAEVSNAYQAASLEIIGFLLAVAELTHARRIVDLGSGFSSFVLRRWAAAQDDPPTIWSVDDHEGWLEKTRGWLEGMGVTADNTAFWDDFIAMEHEPFDLVFHDLGRMDKRAAVLEQVLGLAREGGLVILDDVHKPEFRASAQATLAAKGMQSYSLKRLVRDDIARYSDLVEV